jgi:hypothetical protein
MCSSSFRVLLYSGTGAGVFGNGHTRKAAARNARALWFENYGESSYDAPVRWTAHEGSDEAGWTQVDAGPFRHWPALCL